MSFGDQITPVVLTWNEEPNVERVFGRLLWAREVVAVDSGSTDRTMELLGRYPNVRTITRPFVSHADQLNFAIREARITSEWVLSLDADYVLSDGLVEEIRRLSPAPTAAGFSARFVYWSLGRPLRGSLYPPRIVLFRTSLGEYEQEGHTQRLRLRGDVRNLREPIFHDDRKPLSRWLANQERYATLEAQRLLSARHAHLDAADRIRHIGFVAPALVAAYCLFLRGCILEGRPGLHYTLQRVVAEALLAIRLCEMRATVGRSSTS